MPNGFTVTRKKQGSWEINYYCCDFNPRGRHGRKRPSSGRADRRLICIQPDWNVKKDQRSVSSNLIVLLRSTNKHIQSGLTRGQESARRRPVCVQNIPPPCRRCTRWDENGSLHPSKWRTFWRRHWNAWTVKMSACAGNASWLGV